MSTILSLDLGKFNGVACTLNSEATAARFAPVTADPDRLEAGRPGTVVFETCPVVGQAADSA